MLRPEYIPLIQTLVESTHDGILIWTKAERFHSYCSYPTAEQKVLIDKYYSRVEGQTLTCLNLTIFKLTGEIIDEIVLCRSVEDPNDFELLDSLYREVESQFNKQEEKKVEPVLAQITQSLRERIQGHEQP